MPVSIVVGGQYGSEGKGKVALELVRHDPSITIAVRPGGTNSGHTGYTRQGERVVLRQLPASAIDANVVAVLPAGAYIDVGLLLSEIEQLQLPRASVRIDPRAHVILPEHVAWERNAGLLDSVGSTGSGTGAAVISRLARLAANMPPAMEAADVPALQPYLEDTSPYFRRALDSGERILIEGTQGFGLSPLHGDVWPKCTSRDTTAASLLGEAGLSPLSVDEIVLVLRCHPIRVAGDSGPLVDEISWTEIADRADAPFELTEFTSVTRKVRRVGEFNSEQVRKSILVNGPTKIVLNHLDYIDWECRSGRITKRAADFVADIERKIGQGVSMVGLGEQLLVGWETQPSRCKLPE